MNLREQYQKLEASFLAPYATQSLHSKGRIKDIEPCNIRTCFQRDRDRIVHSKAFRRLKHKTQVFISPEGDHYRTRLTHTLEVSQIARTVGRALRLNEDLIEAIALGHDLGHTPFGHAGEAALTELVPGGFRHNEQSLRVVDVLEKEHGLNCTYEVRDGILNHTGCNQPATLEGQVVRIADRIAYINHDIDDSLRAGVLQKDQLPVECLSALGFSHSERINSMVIDLIENSHGKPEIQMSENAWTAMNSLRDFMFAEVYVDSAAKTEEHKAKDVIRRLFEYYLSNPEKLPTPEQQLLNSTELSNVIADYISGMTDRYIIAIYETIFLPRPWSLK